MEAVWFLAYFQCTGLIRYAGWHIFFFCRDIELACDEKVIKDMDAKQKKIYSKVLLSFSESEKHVLACPLAFGEVGVKERIKSILNYKNLHFGLLQ